MPRPCINTLVSSSTPDPIPLADHNRQRKVRFIDEIVPRRDRPASPGDWATTDSHPYLARSGSSAATFFAQDLAAAVHADDSATQATSTSLPTLDSSTPIGSAEVIIPDPMLSDPDPPRESISGNSPNSPHINPPHPTANSPNRGSPLSTTELEHASMSKSVSSATADPDSEVLADASHANGSPTSPSTHDASPSPSQQKFSSESERHAAITRHPCVNPRCASHAQFIPAHRRPDQQWPEIIRHPRLRERADEPQRWILHDGSDVTESLQVTKDFRQALVPDNGTCTHDDHKNCVNRFRDSVNDPSCQLLALIIPVLKSIAHREAVAYSPRGWAHTLLSDVITHGASTRPDKYCARWRWCLACLLRPKLLDSYRGWRDVWIVQGFINDDTPWLPMWSVMVPPFNMKPYRRRTYAMIKDMIAFYDATPVMGSKDNLDGISIPGIKVSDTKWGRAGGTVSRCLMIKYGVSLPIVTPKHRFRKNPYGNYKELYTDPEIHAAFRRGWAKMVAWGMVIYITGPTFDVIPMFYLFQEKDDGSIKERGIQDGAATGLNDILAHTICVLLGLDDIISDLMSGEFIWTRDLSDAFWHWVYCCRYVLLLGVVCPDQLPAVLTNMLMGISNSPGIQQFFVEDFVNMLAKRNMRRAKPYLDDFTNGHVRLRQAMDDTAHFDLLADFVGLRNAKNKKTPPLLQGTAVLGILIDTIGEGRGYVGEPRLVRYIYGDKGMTVKVLLDIIAAGAAHIPMGAIAKVAGRLGFIAKFVWSGVAHLRELYEGWVQFEHARDKSSLQRHELPDAEGKSEAPPVGWQAEAPRAIQTVLDILGCEENNRDLFQRDHPILNFWWDKNKLKTADCFDPRFPVAVTARLVNCLQWWFDNARTRNGVPLGLDRAEGFRGRLRAELVDIDNDFIDKHSQTPSGFQVISTDAATHGDTDNRPRSGCWWGTSERYETIYTPETLKQYGIFGLEGSGTLRAFRQLGPVVPARELVFRGDNKPGVDATNKGMCRDDDFQELVKLIYEESWLQKKPFCCIWCCTHCMWLADGISRGTIQATSCDFQFAMAEFEVVVDIIKHRPTIDGFANESGDNALCPTWCSLKRCFFQCDFRGHHVWINPDFLFIVEAIEYWLKAKRAAPDCTKATILVPVYKSEPWLRLLEKHFTKVKSYPRGSNLFYTIPATTYGTVEECVDVGPRPRKCIGPTQWAVDIWHCK